MRPVAHGKAVQTLMVLGAFLVAGVVSGHAHATGREFNILDYGAVGDGKTLNTQAFDDAVNACVKAGGGTVQVPAGKYLTGAIFLKSNVTLNLDGGATILGVQTTKDYPIIDSRWEGIERPTYACLVNGIDLVNVSVTGRGTIDGQGAFWWELKRADKLEYPRPRLLGFMRCNNVLVEGITLTNSPAWTINPVYCDNVTVHRVTILNPPDSPNTDGVNPDSSRNVRIANCHIDVGDDCITIKSGRNEDGRRVGKPCENITITNCTMINGHGGVVIGSEMSGGVKNVTISNCTFVGTDRGIRLKTMVGRGGTVEDIRVTNVVMDGIAKQALMLNMFYRDTDLVPTPENTPTFKNVYFSNMTIRNAKEIGRLLGLSHKPLEGVKFTDIVASGEKGFFVKDAKSIEFHDVQVETVDGPAVTCENVADLEIDGLKTRQPRDEDPIIRLRDVENAFVRGCIAYPGTGTFLELNGDKTRDIMFRGNSTANAKEPVAFQKGARKEALIEG